MNREYVIPFVGLKLGIHVFEFDVSDAFFDAFDYAMVRRGKVHVRFTLEKKETMMIGSFELEGVVQAVCDRCSDPLEQKITGNYRLIYHVDAGDSGDENLIYLSPETFELDLSEQILEFITLSLPNRLVHAEGACNQEMMALLEKYRTQKVESEKEEEEKEMDPRWQALKNLKTK